MPVDADEQRGQRVRNRRVRIGRRRGARRHRHAGVLQREPVRRVGPQREEIRLVADARELGEAEHLDRDQARECLQIELGRLHAPRQVDHDQDRLAIVAPQVRQHLAVRTADELDRSAAEHAMLLAHRDEPLHPVEERKRIALLRLDVDRLVAVHRIHDRRREQARRVGAGEPGVAIAAPLHRRADAVAIAEVDVVAHPDLVAVIADGRARHREQHRREELDAAPAVLDERREAAADANVEPHLRVRRVDLIHVVALFVGHHLEGELVMVAQEERPLAVLGNVGRLAQDFGEGVAILLAHRHEHPRHEREVERHVAFVAVAEIVADVGGPLVRLGEQHAVLVGRVERRAHPLQHAMRFRQVLVQRAFPHAQVRHGVEPQRVDAEVEPELHHVDHGVHDRRVVVIQVGLMREEAVPVILFGDRVVRPVRLLRIGEDDPGFGKLLVGVAPHVELALGRSRRGVPRALEPRMLIGRVVDDQLDEDLDVPLVRRLDERLEGVERPVLRVDVPVVGDVVPVVAERRGEERQQPQAGDAEALQVIQLLRDPLKVADAVVVAVEERLDVRLIDDRVLVPKRIVCGGRCRWRDRVNRQTEIGRLDGSHRR